MIAVTVKNFAVNSIVYKRGVYLDTINIALCDDNIDELQIMVSFLSELNTTFSTRINCNMQYIAYSDPNKLIKDLQRGKQFNLFLLDIEMPNVSGIDLGHYIRNDIEDEDSYIIYVSGHSEYIKDLFQIGTYDFIDKPIIKSVFHRKMLSVIDKIKKNHILLTSKFVYQRVGSPRIVRHKDIVSLESHDRKIAITTFINNKYFVDTYNAALKNEIEKLPLPNFIQTHASFVVNLNYMKEYNRKQMILNNDRVIPISQQYSLEVYEHVTYFIENYLMPK
jgi:DNA-binding LytR/AlgR family response regulator